MVLKELRYIFACFPEISDLRFARQIEEFDIISTESTSLKTQQAFDDGLINSMLHMSYRMTI